MRTKTITVFTPTYNRAYTLPNLYNSLLRQTNKDFEWLIIDDGSTDNTQELIHYWISEYIIPIRYIYQVNKGMLAAHNKAYDNINSEFSMCIDSDDYLVDNAIERIISFWNEKGSERYAGILGLDILKDNTVIGDKFPGEIITSTFTNLKSIYKNKGDKKFIYRTSVINEFPRFPEFFNEKFPAAGYLYRLIDQKYELLLLNEPLCIVEYQRDGNSKNKFVQYKKNPNAFAYYRLERMRLSRGFKERFRNAIHYVSSCLFAKKIKNIFKIQYKLEIVLAFPFGVILYIYLKYTNNKSLMK